MDSKDKCFELSMLKEYFILTGQNYIDWSNS
mgnify:CR=1 FL=1